MYNFINDPKTNIRISIHSKAARNIIQKYMFSLMKGGSNEVKDKLTFDELKKACEESDKKKEQIIIKYKKSDFNINGEDVKKLCSDYQVNIRNNNNEICKCDGDICEECNKLIDDCDCKRCEDCEELIDDCECKRCEECDKLFDNCECGDRCDDCEKLVKNCKCERCIDCNELIDDCGCERCPKCNELVMNCKC